MTLKEKQKLFYERLHAVNQFFIDYDVLLHDDVDSVVDEVIYEELGEDLLSIKFKYKKFEEDEYTRLKR